MTSNTISVVRLDQSERVSFAEDSFYQPILNGEAGGYPIFTGIQTAEPGYQTPPHEHPYLEVLHILEGIAEAWLVGREDEKVRLMPGDTIALPPNQPHVFAAVGDRTLRLLGTHLSSQRIVNFVDGTQSVMGKSD
jgi:quercetin dioxygenase-like cupin family protein